MHSVPLKILHEMFLQVDFISGINEFRFNEIVQGLRALITGLLDDDC